MKKKRYISMFLALALCWSGAALSDDDNPFEEAAKEENPLSEAENPFAEVVKGDFNGHYVGKQIDLRLWPEGEIFAGEMKFRGETYPVAAEMKDGGLFCAAGTEEENFTFTLKKEGEKYVVEVGKFREELEERVFPSLENVYDGENGTKVRISKKTVDHYIGTIEFKGRKMPFEADIKGGILEGKIESGKNQINFRIDNGKDKMIFQTGGFTDELTPGSVIISKLLEEAHRAKDEKNWDQVEELAKHICEIDPSHTGAHDLLIDVKEEREKPEKIAKLLEEAREAKEKKDWEEVEKAANQILELESTHEEARELRIKAGEEKVITNLFKEVKEAKERKDWEEVEKVSRKVLSIRSDNAEALKMIDLAEEEKIENLRKEAREAKVKKNWEAVRTKAEMILDLRKGDMEAKQLKEEAEEGMKPQDMTIQLGGKVNLEMVGIKPGTFMMGSPANELGRLDYETQHVVILTCGYWLGKYEVTQGQWKAVMGNNLAKRYGVGSNYPVYNVSWNDAMEFCRKLTEQERTAGRLPAGYAYTLPTEAQWEYACRAGTTTALNSGKNLSNVKECFEIDEVGWYHGNSNRKTHPVGQKKPNAWGLHDMHGNVMEWCLDCCDRDSNYIPITDTYRDGIRDPLCKTGSYRVFRDGSCFTHAFYCRSAFRSEFNPGYRNINYGFRVALSRVQ